MILAATTGMRRSELLGLRWSDVDLDRAQVRVTRTLQRCPDRTLKYFDPKTTRARRVISLPAFVPPILARRELGIEVVPQGDAEECSPVDTALALARLGRETGLKMPDCCALLIAGQRQAEVLTFDERLARAAAAT